MPTTIRVSTTSELTAAISKMTGDTEILLDGGNYGNVNLEERLISQLGSSFDLTIKSASENNPATFKELNLVGGKNITFDGIEFDYTAKFKAAHAYRPFKVEDSEGITVQNSIFDGDEAFGHGDYQDGYGTGAGLFVRGSTGVMIQNNEMFNWERAVIVFESENVKILENEIYDSSSDGINLAEIKNGLVEGNYIHDFDADPDTLAHKDMIQVWTTNTSSSTENLTIRGNVLDSGEGVYTQSIYMFNEDNVLYRNITIEDNVIRNAHKHGITIEDARVVNIRNNTIIQNEDTANDDPDGVFVPAINVWRNVTDATVQRNVVPEINVLSGGVSQNANLIVQRNAPTQEGYYEDLFLNALSDSRGTWEDLKVAPNSYLEQQNLGSSLLYFDTTPEDITPLLLVKAGKELQLGEYEFNATNVYGPSGAINTNGAKASWDFGDGTTGTGLDVLHAYSKAGTYHVTGVVTLADGTKLDVQKTVETEAPAALISNFESRGFDRSGEETDYGTEGSVSFIKDGGDGAVKLGTNGRVRYETGEEFYDNTAFTVMVDYRKDNVSDRGKLISFFGSTVLFVNDHQISGTVWTDQGSVRLTESYLPVANTDWHKVALTFDGEAGQIRLYFDGELVASQNALKGAIQEGISSQDFYVGSPLGDTMPGIIDNAAFLRGALTEAEIAALHANDTTIDAVLDAYASAPVDETPPAPAPVASEAPEPAKPEGELVTSSESASGSSFNANFSTDEDDYDTATFGDSKVNNIRGTSGDDYQEGYSGNDRLNGHGGDDFLSGSAGRDTYYAGAGNDIMVFDEGDAVVHGESGIDTLYFDRSGNYDATRVTIHATEIFDLQNSARNTVEFSTQQIRKPTTELLIRADASDKVIIDEAVEIVERSTFNRNDETYTRYEISTNGWSETFAIDADAALEVNGEIIAL